MDLWSWIWILTIAQSIQARRNGFHKITNIWFELWKITAYYSNSILELLWLWKVINQDTTKASLFWHIPQDETITFVSNETVPDPYSPINIDRIDSDPFFENNKNIFSNGKVFLNNETQFFPKIVRVQNNKKSITLNKENKFTNPEILPNIDTSFFLKAEKDLFYPESQYSFRDIFIWNDLLPLEYIWKDLQKKWLITKLPNLSPRWCTDRYNQWL
jgi:hypothetical protein